MRRKEAMMHIARGAGWLMEEAELDVVLQVHKSTEKRDL
jgi:hypothetical protein